MNELEKLAQQLGIVLLARGEWLTAAESCTGGWLAQSVTAIAGSSAWFDRGFVTYSNAAKVETVSYTHLDVYKRQRSSRALNSSAYAAKTVWCNHAFGVG